MKAHKFLRHGARGPLSQHVWSQPPAASNWLEAAAGPLVPCRNGLHACRIDQLSYWIADELWEVELGDEWIEAPHSLVARRARLLRRIEAWQGAAALEFTRACLERAQAASARAGQSSALASQYLEATQQFADAGKPALTAYASALVHAALGPADQQMASFDAERRAQGQLLAMATGI